jgi:hypothetical protein
MLIIIVLKLEFRIIIVTKFEFLINFTSFIIKFFAIYTKHRHMGYY